MPSKPLCQAKKTDGSSCKTAALPGSTFCFFHDPARQEQRTAARRAGGKSRRKKAAAVPADTADLPLECVGDVVALLGQTINQVRKATLDVKAANAVGYLATVLLWALEGGELARQLEELRAEVQRLKHGDRNDAPGGRPAAGGSEGPGP
jgi:hypothetical protein